MANKKDSILDIVIHLPLITRIKLHFSTANKLIESNNIKSVLDYYHMLPLEEDKNLTKIDMLVLLIKNSDSKGCEDIFKNFQIVCEWIEEFSNGFQQIFDLIGLVRNELFSSVNFQSEFTTLKSLFYIKKNYVYEAIVREYVNYKNMYENQKIVFLARLDKLTFYQAANIADVDEGINVFQMEKVIFYYIAYHFKILSIIDNESIRADIAMKILNFLLPGTLADNNKNRRTINKITADYFSSRMALGGKLENFRLFSFKPKQPDIKVIDKEAKSEPAAHSNLLKPS